MTEERAEYRVQKLKDYHNLAKELLALADKATVEEVARILAVHVGYMERRHGEFPMEETLRALHTESELTGEQAADLEAGMKKLVAVLALATGVGDESQERN